MRSVTIKDVDQFGMARAPSHTSFFIIKELTSLFYGLGLDLVHPDFPFQSIREKYFQRESRGWQTLVSASLFEHCCFLILKNATFNIGENWTLVE